MMIALWIYLAINIGITVYLMDQLKDVCEGESVVKTFLITVSWLALISPYIAYDKFSRYRK